MTKTKRNLWLPRRAVSGGRRCLARIHPPGLRRRRRRPSPAARPSGAARCWWSHEDASGRIVALDSSSYLGPHKTHPTDVIVVGSYCGTRILAPMFTRGVKAVIATDAGIGKDNAGISGLLHGETIDVPVATIAAMSAETSNGRETLLLGTISRANKQARALGVEIGMIAYEAAARLAKAPPGKSIPTPLGNEEDAGRGRARPPRAASGRRPAPPRSRRRSRTTWSAAAPILAACPPMASCAWAPRARSPTTPASPATTPRSRASALLAEKGVPSAAVATMSARLGEGLSTWNDGVISVVNAPAAKLGRQGRDDRQGGRAADARLSQPRRLDSSHDGWRSSMDRRAVRSYVYRDAPDRIARKPRWPRSKSQRQDAAHASRASGRNCGSTIPTIPARPRSISSATSTTA